MKNNQLLNLIKQGYFVVPLYLLALREKLSLSMEHFIFLLFLMNKGERFVFNPKELANEYSCTLEKVMEEISYLSDKNFLHVEVSKNDKGVMEENVTLEDCYVKINHLLLEDFQQEKENTDLFAVIEKEFGRPLSPMEYEIIKAWIDNHMSEELILAALKEATYNGVSNLRYIDKILYEWSKKGYQNASDVNEGKKQWKERESQPKVEVFDYNWFDDDDDESEG